jgi:class 3 adenylate cyclase/tetratricopeptide (TPR) repeat protein
MICPGCKTENRTGRRFCAACGQGLPLPCPACGFENAADDRFCGGCGKPLGIPAAAPAPSPAAKPEPAAEVPLVNVPEVDMPVGEIRPVTIMFVDICGYTNLSGRLDPEDTHRLLQQFFEAADAVVVRFGGRIDKHIGDSVMALFGAPIAHGNDAEHAALAALAIHEAMPAISAKVGQDLQVHIGIATGEVVASGLGSAAHSAYTVIGDAVNLAARLMDRAGAGETLVSATVRQGSEHAIAAESMEMSSLGPLNYKGIASPVETFRLTAKAAGSAAKSAARPLVGRRAELAQATALIESVAASRSGAAVVLRGEPGIGKSRLSEELFNRAGARGFLALKALVLDFGAARERSVERVLASGLLAAVADADDNDNADDNAEQRLGQTGLDSAGLLFLRDLLDLAQPEDSRATYEAMSNASRNRGKSDVLAKLATRVAETRPVYILIEDVHWSDPVVRGHVTALVEATGAAPLMLAMTTRVDGDPFDATFRAGLRHGHLTVIDLSPLGAADAESMAHALRVDFDDFARRCIARAEGNPLFLEQLLRGAADPKRLPESLQSVVLARLDQLPPKDRQALQAASILGQRFEIVDLGGLINQAGYDPGELLRRQLVRPEGSGLLFAHALIRDGAYASLTRERRTALHQTAAALFKDRDAALHAEHLDRADDPAAARAYLAAAEAEAAAYRVDRAMRLAERGLEVAKTPEDRGALAPAVGRYALDIGLGKAARAAFAVLAASETPPARCRGLIGLAASDRMLAAIPQAMESLAAAEPIATSLDDAALLSEICYLRGNLHFALGQADECLAEHKRALAAAERAGLPEWNARARSGLGDAYYMQGRFKSAAEQFMRTAELAKENNLLRIVWPNQAMAGNTAFYSLDFEKAFALVDSAKQVAVEIGDRFGEMFATECRAVAYGLLGRWAELEPVVIKGIEMARALGAKRYVSIQLPLLAQVRHIQDRHDEAEAAVREAMEIAEETGPGFCGAIVCGIAACVERDPERQRTALARGEELLRQTGLSHNHIWFRLFAIDWGLTHKDWAEVERQIGRLSQYTAAEPLPFVDLLIERARAYMQLGRVPDDTAAITKLRAILETARDAGFGPGFELSPA